MTQKIFCFILYSADVDEFFCLAKGEIKMPRGIPNVVNFEEKIAAIKGKIEKKQNEIKDLRSQLVEAEAAYQKHKNKELMDLLSDKGIDASRAGELIRRALEMEQNQNPDQNQGQPQ